jgi:hypothetical protein
MGIFDKVREGLSRGLGEKTPVDPQDMKQASDQSKEEIELASFVKEKVEESRSTATRISSEGIWLTNICYLLGYDSVYYDPQLRTFRPLSGSTRYIPRNRLRTNLLLPACQNRLARLLKNPPRYDVRPNSMTEEDKEAAELGVEYIGVVWDKQAINKKRIEMSMWMQQCGHAYFKVSYDEDLGDPMINPITGESEGMTGDVRVDVASALECFPDALARTFEECSHFTQAKVRKLNYFREKYPERGHLVKEEGAWLLSAQYEMRINSLNSTGPQSSGTSEQMKNAAIELSYYEKPSRKYPNGRHVIVANGVVLKNAELPYGEIPFAKFDDVLIGGKYYSESLITHGRPLQDQYNRTISKRAEWTNKLLAGKYIAAKGHGLAQEALNDTTEVVEYDPVHGATEPKAMSIPVMPQYAFTESDMTKKDLYEIFGLSEVSRGILPSAGIPAQGMQILLEQDETRIGIEVEAQEHSYARMGQLILKCAAKHIVMDTKLKLKTSSGYQVKNFNGNQLRDNLDVTVIRGSTIPNNKVVKRQEIMNLYGQGLLGNPQDPQVIDKLLGLLEYGDLGDVWTKHHLDCRQIAESIDLIEQGIVPPFNEKLDNHALHIVKKNEFRLSEKFQQMPPEFQQLLLDDIDRHIDAGAALANPVPPLPDDGMPVPTAEQMALMHQQAMGLGIPVPPPGMNVPQGPMPGPMAQ